MAINEKQPGDKPFEVVDPNGKRAQLWAGSFEAARDLAAAHFKINSRWKHMIAAREISTNDDLKELKG